MNASLIPSVDVSSTPEVRGARGEVAKTVRWTDEIAPLAKTHMIINYSDKLIENTWAFICGSLEFSDCSVSDTNSIKADWGCGVWVPYPSKVTTHLASVCIYTGEPNEFFLVFQFAADRDDYGKGTVSVKCKNQDERIRLYKAVCEACAANFPLGFIVLSARCIVNKFQINTGKVTGCAKGVKTFVRLGAITICTTFATADQAEVAIQETHSQIHAALGHARADDFDIFFKD